MRKDFGPAVRGSSIADADTILPSCQNGVGLGSSPARPLPGTASRPIRKGDTTLTNQTSHDDVSIDDDSNGDRTVVDGPVVDGPVVDGPGGESSVNDTSAADARIDPRPEASSDDRSIRWVGVGLIGSIGTAAGIYLAAGWLDPDHRRLSPGYVAAMRSVDVFVVLWVLWVGGSIGSFLNVVAYRLPRGRSVSGRSHCPRCDHQLAWRDNTPIFGWFLLGGRCRTCGGKISPRYPIVETAVAITLGCIVLPRLYNVPLPHLPPPLSTGQFGGRSLSDPMTWTLIAMHSAALIGLWTMALIRFDNVKIPRALASVVAIIAGVILVLPAAAVEHWKQRGVLRAGEGIDMGVVDAILRCITALVMAALIGRSLARGLSPAADLKLSPLAGSTRRLVDLIVMLSVVTLVVGWQTSIGVVVVASVVAAVAMRAGGGNAGATKTTSAGTDPLGWFAVSLPVVLSLQIALWYRMHRQGWYPSDGADPMVIVAWGAAALCIPIWLGKPKVAS